MKYPVLPADLAMVELYKDILPHRIFDAHAHLYTKETAPHAWSEQGNFCRDFCRIADYRADMAPFYPGVEEMRINAIPMPDPVLRDKKNGLRDCINDHVAEEASADRGSVGSAYVLMGDTATDIERMTSSPSVRAIKCYWYAAKDRDGESCMIRDFLPENAWEVASAKKIPIVLHMMHHEALADERNLSYIIRMTDRYPDAPLVLAHCARAFASWTVVEAVGRLASRENVWFDLAAIAEPTPMMACIKASGGKRVMWGTDYPICMFRGKTVSIGKGFYWLPAEAYPKSVEPALLITESLLAFRQASLLLDLDRTDLDRIFYDNAVSLFRP